MNGRLVGRGDTPYTQRGQLQKALLVKRIAEWEPDVVLSSPLRRAREVAEGACRLAQASLTFDERLTELDFGLAEGLTHDEIRQRGIAFDFRSLDAPVCEGGESRRSIFDRSAAVVDAYVHSGTRIAIVSHGGVFRSLVTHLCGLPVDAIWSFDIHPAAVCEVRVIDGFGLLNSFESAIDA